MRNAAGPSGRNREPRTFTVPGVSHGGDGMRDVYAKLAWAEKHLADLMSLAREYLRPGGGDDRPLGIEFDNRRPPIVVARFIAEQPLPVEISLHAGDLVHNARTALDHTLARVKDRFGGDGRSGTFPITRAGSTASSLARPPIAAASLAGAAVSRASHGTTTSRRHRSLWAFVSPLVFIVSLK
jgi:hypothetical protein